MSADLVFVDTSVLLFSEDGARPAERELVLAWLRALWSTRRGRVSVQVLNDFYLLATRQISPAMPQGDARAEVRRYQHWRPWATDQATVDAAWSLESRFGLPFADALVVASAKAQGCTRLLSLALPHDAVFDSVQVLNPLVTAP
ncbi:PIN domain-containing protein [Roseateles sp.]|uniref:PIN domain-containing protein n=1 Tax=Roseateles sp. TaxID=1971397 RepID=UPI003265FA0E